MPDVQFDIQCNVPAASVNGAFVGFEQTTQPGEGPPLHTHRNESELFHIIDGRYVFECNGERREAAAGDTVLIPPGAPHSFKNIGDTPGRVHFILFPPADYEKFFERVVNEFNNIEDHAAFFNEYGMDLNGPPLA